MNWQWDKWQQQVLEHQGNITIRAGRQVGKSEVISEKAYGFAKNNPGTVTLIIAASQRQSGLLFEKVRGRADEDGAEYAEQPTLTRIILANGSRIYSLPAGRTAYSIRGYTIDLLIADEAAYIPETVWLAVTPMLAVSSKTRGFGWIITISTPFGKGGYFFNTFTDKDFLAIHVSSEDCRRIDKLFLKKERDRMTKAQYRQEYQGEFCDEYHQYFSTELIKECMTFIEWNKKEDGVPGAKYYLGQDLARMGGDEIADVVVELDGKNLKAVWCRAMERQRADVTIGETVVLNDHWQFTRIFTDSAGLGGPILDLMQERLGKRLVIGLSNATRRIEVQGEEKKKGILKEDLYNNTLMLMETGRLKIIADLNLLRSMKSITYEYTEQGNLKIFGPYSHLTEALVRACWCVKDRGLDLYIR